MTRTGKSAWELARLSVVLGLMTGCGQDPVGPTPEEPANVVVLNSTGQTLTTFLAGDNLSPAGAPIDLGASFDGDALDVAGNVAASSISSFGGSRIVFADLGTRSVRTAAFPAPEGDGANPSRPAFDEEGVLWVGGRGSDAVYRVDPGQSVAVRVAESVGTFVERVLPVGGELWVVDANLDDDGLTYQPRGTSRIVVMDRDGTWLRTMPLPDGALNARDAILAGGRVVVLVAGTIDPVSFAPDGNGSLLVIEVDGLRSSALLPLGGNGIALELGQDGDVYVTVSRDFDRVDLLRFDPQTEAFVRGPGNPLEVRDGGGERVDCWVATGLTDGRLVCATFSFAEPGRLVLTDGSGQALSEVASGFGSTDVHVLP